MTKSLRTILLATLALAVMRPAAALPILGEQLFYSGGEITVEILSPTAAYTSDLNLYLLDPSTSILRTFGINHDVGDITVFNPGDDFGFSIGDELIFGIDVHNTGYTYFMGAGDRNPDGLIHATVDADYFEGANDYLVGFEDLLHGGDLDYDDNRFRFSGGLTTSVPEPGTLILAGLGLLGMGLTRRRTS